MSESFFHFSVESGIDGSNDRSPFPAITALRSLLEGLRCSAVSSSNSILNSGRCSKQSAVLSMNAASRELLRPTATQTAASHSDIPDLATNFGSLTAYQSAPRGGITSHSTPIPQLQAQPIMRRGSLVSSGGDMLLMPPDILHILMNRLVERSRRRAECEISGLKDAARLSTTCRSMHTAYRRLLEANPGLALQAESLIRAAVEKRKLVRRLTLSQHEAHVKKEVAVELVVGLIALVVVSAACLVWPRGCSALGHLVNTVALVCTHLVIHTVVLAASYRAAATVGVKLALLWGLLGIAGYYLVLVRLLQRGMGISQMPPQLNLEPWGRPEGSPMPFYPAAVLTWAFFGTSTKWMALQMAACVLAWVYGVYEWSQSLGVVKSRNKIR